MTTVLPKGEQNSKPGSFEMYGSPKVKKSNSKLRLRLAVLIVLTAIVFLIYKGIGSAIQYYLTTKQAVAQRGQLGTSPFRIKGTVVAGTLHRVGTNLYFSIEQSKVVVPVISTGNPPQMFKPGIPVVLDGHFGSSGLTFYSSKVMVKHSNAYTPAKPSAVPKVG